MPRGKYLEIFPNRFLPAPIPLKYSPFIETNPSDDENVRFTSFFQSLHFATEELPYDLHCPSVKDNIQDRICNQCNKYFASLTLLNNHKKMHPKQKSTWRQKIKSKKILKKKENEVLALLEDDDGFEVMDWLDVDMVDNQNLSGISKNLKEQEEYMQIFSIAEHLDPLWKNV